MTAFGTDRQCWRFCRHTRALQQYLGHRNIAHTTLYTELAADRFAGFWQD